MVGFTGSWHWEDQLDNAKHDPEGLTSSCAGPFQRPLRPVSKHYACLSMYAGVDLFQGRNISQHAETLHPSNPTKCWAGAAWEKPDWAMVEDAAHTLWRCRYPSLLEPIALRQLVFDGRPSPTEQKGQANGLYPYRTSIKSVEVWAWQDNRSKIRSELTFPLTHTMPL